MAGVQRPVRWGLIGASSIARGQVQPAIRAAGGEIAAVFSTDPARGLVYAAECGIPKITASLDELLADPGIDAVYVSTTNELHCPQTIAAARAGKHVLSEKPLAMSLADGRAMIAACERARVVLATNHHLRNSGAHGAIREAIAAGRIGRPIAARAFQAIRLPEHLQGWRLSSRSAGAGALLDIAVHCVDTLRFTLDDDPLSAVGMIQNIGMAAAGVDDGAMGVLAFGSGLLAQIHVGFSTAHAGTGFEVHGSEGSLIAHDVMTARPGGTLLLRTASGDEPIPFEERNIHEHGIRKFHAAMRGEGAPAASGLDGLWSLASALAIGESARTGRTVSIDIAG